MEYRILLKADFKRHKGSLAGICFLMLLVSAALGTVFSVWTNSEKYIREEIQRAGFGTLTAWVSGVHDMAALAGSIADLDEVDRVEAQEIIYADYAVNGQKSDSEGQLILIDGNENRYRFFENDLTYARRDTGSEIMPGEVYVSPSMASMFGVKAGDEISFPISRSGAVASFTIKGFYEDPFMGSSMIGMKGFLIEKSDYEAIAETIRKSGIDALARSGAMLHIFQEAGSSVPVSELNTFMNEQTKLPEYTEFVHSEGAVAGFMLILQNAFCGLLSAFAAVLLFVVMVVLGHSISSSIEAEYADMGILKTVGFTGTQLRRVQMIQYLAAILSGMAGGLIMAVFLSRFAGAATLTATGIRIPADLPPARCFLSFAFVLLILTGFIALKSGKINGISPMAAIRGETGGPRGGGRGYTPIWGRYLTICLAVRQLTAGKRTYAGACLVAVLLVFFASLIGRMDSWLGADGQGMMSAFNPADHDIGVQVSGRHTAEEAENTIRFYTDIKDSYQLAMPGVSVNGIDYKANVISEPHRFHITDGTSCLNDNEIVLTEFVASDLGVSIGDTVTVRADSGSGEYTVSGIYTCANDLGNNVGLSRGGYLKIGKDHPDIWCSHYFLADSSQKSMVTEALNAAYGGDVHVHENTWPGLYGIISAMQALLLFMYVMVIIFIMVVTAMTGSKILSAEQKDIGIYKAIGFTSGRLRRSFALRFGMAAAAGSLIGAVLAAAMTDLLVSAVMKMAGISSFSSAFTVENTLFPAAVVVLFFTGFAYAASWRVKKADLTVLITE